MSGFATINGVNKALGDGWATINGVWRKLGTGYVVKDGVWAKVTSSGMPLSGLPVGALASMNVNGVARSFIIVHQGLPASMYDSSCDGTWVLMNDIYEEREWDSGDNDYANSDIHAYLNGDFLGLFDSGIQSVVKQVKIPYQNGTGSGGSVSSGASGLSTKVFLLSGYEVGWTTSTNSGFPIDGACLNYFSGTSATDTKRNAYYNGTVTNWWLRSPNKKDARAIWRVTYEGSSNGNNYYAFPFGIRPALILPSDVLVNPTPNADGSYTLLV